MDIIENPYNKSDILYELYQYEVNETNWNKFVKSLKKTLYKNNKNFGVLYEICEYLQIEQIPKTIKEAKKLIIEEIKYLEEEN